MRRGQEQEQGESPYQERSWPWDNAGNWPVCPQNECSRGQGLAGTLSWKLGAPEPGHILRALLGASSTPAPGAAEKRTWHWAAPAASGPGVAAVGLLVPNWNWGKQGWDRTARWGAQRQQRAMKLPPNSRGASRVEDVTQQLQCVSVGQTKQGGVGTWHARQGVSGDNLPGCLLVIWQPVAFVAPHQCK